MGGRGSASGKRSGKGKAAQEASKAREAARQEAAKRAEFEANTGGALEYNAPAQKVETVTRDRRGRGLYSGGFSYDDTILTVSADKNGNLTFAYAKAEEYNKSAPTNVKGSATFEIRHGAVIPRRGDIAFYGINWDKVQSAGGKESYAMKDAFKKNGLTKWDSAKKRWRRP